MSHLYSTGKDSTEVVADLAGLSEDAAGWLRTNVTAGRPDLTELCSDLSLDQSSTIFVCGPVRQNGLPTYLLASDLPRSVH